MIGVEKVQAQSIHGKIHRLKCIIELTGETFMEMGVFCLSLCVCVCVNISNENSLSSVRITNFAEMCQQCVK